MPFLPFLHDFQTYISFPSFTIKALNSFCYYNSDGTIWNIELPPAYRLKTYIFKCNGVITTESITNYSILIQNNMSNTFIGLDKFYGSLCGFMVDEEI